MEQKFCISGVRISIRSSEELGCSMRWQQFLDNFTVADLIYEIRYAHTLPEREGIPEFESRRVCVNSTGNCICRTYFDVETGLPAAFAEEQKDGSCAITVKKSLYPWGGCIEHLFEVYALPHYLLRFDRLMLHCAYIEHNTRAILFTAPSGTGKTTQAKLWQQYQGSTIINGDRAAVSMTENCVFAHGLPISGSSSDCENKTLPVAAIVCLSQAGENCLTRLRGLDAIKQLLRGVYLLPEFRAEFPMVFSLADKITQKAPVFHLACLPNQDAVTMLANALQ